MPETYSNNEKKYTIDDLKKAVFRACDINNYYLNKLNNKKYILIWKNENPKNLLGEQWKQCKQPYDSYEASNYGRIRLTGTTTILKQCETNPEFANITQPELKNYIADNQNSCKIGLLKVQNLSTHTLVASAWLGEKTLNWETHHISGDGYDNSPSNLIYLPHDVHELIPKCNNYSKIGEKKYHGPKFEQ